MKSTRAVFRVFCILVATGLALGAAAERRALASRTQENQALRQQLSQMNSVLVGNQRLPATAAQMDAAPARPGKPLETQARSNEPTNELIRLRKEVATLQRQYQELETLRADTRQVRAAVHNGPNGGPANAGKASDSSDFEIVRAEYWTANTNMDVAAELQDRVRGNRLKAVASNNIKGDPEYGQTKHLTVVYRAGGIVRTNEFREGDVIVLPPEQNASE